MIQEPILSPLQMRLARVLLDLTQEQAGRQWGLARRTVAQYEREFADLSRETQQRILEQLRAGQVFFGPGVSVCHGVDLFVATRGEENK